MKRASVSCGIGAVPVQQRARRRHGRDQRRRQHHVADAQAGKQRFGEGADIDRPFLRIQALHAGGGLAGVVEFAVIVVLDDPGLAPPRPVDHRQPAFQRQRGAGGELVRGRHGYTARADRAGSSSRSTRMPSASSGTARIPARRRRRPCAPRDRPGPRCRSVRRRPAARWRTASRPAASWSAPARARGGRAPRSRLSRRWPGAAVPCPAAGCAAAPARHIPEHLPRQAFPGRQRKTARFRHAGREGARGQEFAHAAVLEHGAAALAQAQRRLLRAGAQGPSGRPHCARSDTKLPLPTRRRMKPSHAAGRRPPPPCRATRPVTGPARAGGQGRPASSAPSRISWRTARWMRVQRQGAVGGSPTQALTDSSCACLNTIGLDLCEKVVGNSRPFQDYKSGYRFMPAAPSPGTPYRPCLPSVRIPRSLERSRPPRRRRADLGHRQLRRHLHPGVPGRQGCRPEPRADGLLGLVCLDRRGRDRADPELGRARAHHHRLVDPGRRLPGDGAGHALRRGGGRLPGVGCGLRAAGPVGLVRARDPADPAGRGRRAAGRHPAAVRHPGFWRRERGSGAGRPVDRGLCDPRVTARYAVVGILALAWPSCCCSSAST